MTTNPSEATPSLGSSEQSTQRLLSQLLVGLENLTKSMGEQTEAVKQLKEGRQAYPPAPFAGVPRVPLHEPPTLEPEPPRGSRDLLGESGDEEDTYRQIQQRRGWLPRGILHG